LIYVYVYIFVCYLFLCVCPSLEVIVALSLSLARARAHSLTTIGSNPCSNQSTQVHARQYGVSVLEQKKRYEEQHARVCDVRARLGRSRPFFVILSFLFSEGGGSN
jgi:hypothetical protein